MGSMPGDLHHLFVVVISNQRLVWLQEFERFDRFDRVRVNNAVPDVILPFFLRKMLDLLVNSHEFGNTGNVETRAGIVERLYDRGITVSLDGKINLDAGQVLTKLSVIFPERLVVHYNQRRAMRFGQLKQCSLIHVRSAVLRFNPLP